MNSWKSLMALFLARESRRELIEDLAVWFSHFEIEVNKFLKTNAEANLSTSYWLMVNLFKHDPNAVNIVGSVELSKLCCWT